MFRMLRIRRAIHLARTEPIVRSTAKPKKKPRNSLFQFRNFAVDDGRCAMKVGTDGVVLGLVAAEMISNGCLVNKQQSEEEQHGDTSSLAENAAYLPSSSMLREKITGSTCRGRRDRHLSVLDIGVGSGLVSLILAQCLVETEVDAERLQVLGGPSASSSLTMVGTDVDEEALIAAERNFYSAILANASWQRQGVRFEGRRVLLGAGSSSSCDECSSPTFPLDDWSPHAVACGAHQEEQDTSSSLFDIIVSNPPFFNPLKSWRDNVHGNLTRKKSKQCGLPSKDQGVREQQPQHAPDVFQQQRDAARLYDSLPPQDLAAQIFSRLRRPSPTMSNSLDGLSSSAVVIYPVDAMKTFLDSVATLNTNTREAGHDGMKQWCLELVHLMEIHDTVLNENNEGVPPVPPPPVRMLAHLQWGTDCCGVRQPQRLRLPLHVSKVDRTFSEEYLRLAKHVYKIRL